MKCLTGNLDKLVSKNAAAIIYAMWCFGFCCVFIFLIAGNAFGGDFYLNATDMSVSEKPAYKTAGKVTATVRNESDLHGPYGGEGTFDIRIIVTKPDGTQKSGYADNVSFSANQTKTISATLVFDQPGRYLLVCKTYSNSGYESGWTEPPFDNYQEWYAYKPDTSLTVTNPSFTLGESVQLRATLKAGSYVLSSKNVSFEVAGKSCSSLTDLSGVALCNVSPGRGGMITASFSGDTRFSSCSGTGSLTAQKRSSLITVNNISGVVGDNIRLVARLQDKTSYESLAGKSIYFSAAGKSCSGLTNSSGFAECSIQINQAGNYSVSAAFSGNDIYNSTSGKGSMEITAPTYNAGIVAVGFDRPDIQAGMGIDAGPRARLMNIGPPGSFKLSLEVYNQISGALVFEDMTTTPELSTNSAYSFIARWVPEETGPYYVVATAHDLHGNLFSGNSTCPNPRMSASITFSEPPVSAMLEYYVEGTNGQVYLVPVGEPFEDEYGQSIIKEIPIEEFYIKQNGFIVYPDSNTASQLYAASKALTKLLSFPYESAVDQLSIASYEAAENVGYISRTEYREAGLSYYASIASGQAHTWAAAGAFCAIFAIPSAGTSCVLAAAGGTAATIVSIADAMGTLSQQIAETQENIQIADLNVIVGRQLMNKGHTLMMDAEQLAQAGNQQSSPANYWDILVRYRDLAEAVNLFNEAMSFFGKNSVSTANYYDRVGNAWRTGAVPSFSSFSYLWSRIEAGERLEIATQQAIDALGQGYSNIFDNDVFYSANLNNAANYFSSAWHTPIELPDISITLSVTERTAPGTMRIEVNHDSSITASELLSYNYDFGDGTGLYSQRVGGGEVPTPSVDHTYKNNGNYTVRVTFTAIDGRTSSATRTITVTTAPNNDWTGLNKTEISRLYVAIFNRASESEGNLYWQSLGLDMATTADVMLETDAAKNYFGNSLDSNQAFIEHIYFNTLNKTPAQDPEGIAYWVGLLDDGTSRGSVVASLVSVIGEYAPGGPDYDPSDAAAVAAYNQFTNRTIVSDYMAENVEKTPTDWEVSTSFGNGLIVSDDPASVAEAKKSVERFNSPPLPMELSRTVIDLEPGESTTITISGGSGHFNVVNSDTQVATASISGKTLGITALSEGKITLVVTDAGSGSASVDVSVISTPGLTNYSENFSNDPDYARYISSNAGNCEVKWTGDSYYARVYDQNSDWWCLGHSPAFIPFSTDEDFTVEFDFNPVDMDWGHYPGISFHGSAIKNKIDLQTNHNNGTLFRFVISYSDGNYKKLRFIFSDPSGDPAKSYSTHTAPAENEWYRVTIAYHAATSTADLKVLRENGSAFYEKKGVDAPLSGIFNYLSIGEVGSGPAYGNKSEIMIDNIMVNHIAVDSATAETGFKVSSTPSEYGSDHNQVCENEFGSGWAEADWMDLKEYYSGGGDMDDFISSSGIDTKKNAWVTRNGKQSYSSTRDYFVSYHDHSRPGNYLAHDNIDNYLVSLGSWDGAYPVLCKKKPASPLPADNVRMGILENIGGSLATYYWGDGNNDLYQQWSVHTQDNSGWFYGSSSGGSNADVYVYKFFSDPTNIKDASIFEYRATPVVAEQGDTVFFRGTNGFYGAWVISDIFYDETNPVDGSSLNGKWFFITDGSANFTGNRLQATHK